MKKGSVLFFGPRPRYARELFICLLNKPHKNTSAFVYQPFPFINLPPHPGGTQSCNLHGSTVGPSNPESLPSNSPIGREANSFGPLPPDWVLLAFLTEVMINPSFSTPHHITQSSWLSGCPPLFPGTGTPLPDRRSLNNSKCQACIAHGSPPNLRCQCTFSTQVSDHARDLTY